MLISSSKSNFKVVNSVSLVNMSEPIKKTKTTGIKEIDISVFNSPKSKQSYYNLKKDSKTIVRIKHKILSKKSIEANDTIYKDLSISQALNKVNKQSYKENKNEKEDQDNSFKTKNNILNKTNEVKVDRILDYFNKKDCKPKDFIYKTYIKAEKDILGDQNHDYGNYLANNQFGKYFLRRTMEVKKDPYYLISIKQNSKLYTKINKQEKEKVLKKYTIKLDRKSPFKERRNKQSVTFLSHNTNTSNFINNKKVNSISNPIFIDSLDILDDKSKINKPQHSNNYTTYQENSRSSEYSPLKLNQSSFKKKNYTSNIYNSLSSNNENKNSLDTLNIDKDNNIFYNRAGLIPIKSSIISNNKTTSLSRISKKETYKDTSLFAKSDSNNYTLKEIDNSNSPYNYKLSSYFSYKKNNYQKEDSYLGYGNFKEKNNTSNCVSERKYTGANISSISNFNKKNSIISVNNESLFCDIHPVISNSIKISNTSNLEKHNKISIISPVSPLFLKNKENLIKNLVLNNYRIKANNNIPNDNSNQMTTQTYITHANNINEETMEKQGNYIRLHSLDPCFNTEKLSKRPIKTVSSKFTLRKNKISESLLPDQINYINKYYPSNGNVEEFTANKVRSKQVKVNKLVFETAQVKFKNTVFNFHHPVPNKIKFSDKVALIDKQNLYRNAQFY